MHSSGVSVFSLLYYSLSSIISRRLAGADVLLFGRPSLPPRLPPSLVPPPARYAPHVCPLPSTSWQTPEPVKPVNPLLASIQAGTTLKKVFPVMLVLVLVVFPLSYCNCCLC